MSCKNYFLIVCSLLSIIVFPHSETKTASTNNVPKLLVVSYDGFRHDFFNRGYTPFLKELKTNGTHADYMKNVFITMTFPNHYTISTGLYIETHGVIDNKFYDPKSNKTYKFSKELFQYNDDILPIWAVNERVGRHSGTMMWPGGEYEYQGKNITFTESFSLSTSFEERIDNLISWFNHPTTPINFGMLYIEDPDHHAHGIGINSPRFNEVLKKIDQITKYLHSKLKGNSLEDLNVVHLSDHGMSTVTMNRLIDFTLYIGRTGYVAEGSSPTINIYPDEDKKDFIYNQLKVASSYTKKFDVYLKEDIPVKYHFLNNSRIAPIFMVAKVGYSFHTLKKGFPIFEKEFNITIDKNSEFGVHGYDNDADEMHPFFFGVGPAFVPQCKVPPFFNIDLFSLFCDILDLQCPASNGTLTSLKPCLTKYQIS